MVKASISYVRKLLASMLVAVIAVISLGQGTVAETGGPQYEQMMQKQYDYILYVDVYTINKFMNYKGSQFTPMDVLVVTFKRTTSPFSMQKLTPEQLLPRKYEEIWYANGKAVGMKRFIDLPVNAQLQGAIYFRSDMDNGVGDHTLPCANCAVRLLLDIYIKRSILAAVIVPGSCFQQFGTDLGQLNFFLLTQAIGGGGATMTMHVTSYPRGLEKYYAFTDKGRPN